jgi:outer membrane scaffolding protein for murein synthesis (MipA/OmpV family)
MRLTLPAVLALSLLPQVAFAGELMDYIRNYDLNNYALGLAVSTSQSPYAGDDNGTWGYPYLSSFRNAAFTDDWLLINDGDLGARWVSDNGWVLGAVGRINAGGFGNTESEELQGLEERQWTVELGPLIGWRGWPLHLEYKLYMDAFDRADGLKGEFTVSFPTEYSWGYLVPYVKLVHQDSDYNNYYYGVSADEALPSRQEYSAGASNNIVAQFRVGYAISERWLLTGYIASEWLGSSIQDSPIVDEDQIWSFNLGLAYNADIFQPRTYSGEAIRMPRFEFQVGAYRNNIDSRFFRNSSDGSPSDEIDGEETLGLDEEQTVLQFDAITRIGLYHRFELSYFELSRKASAEITADVRIGDEPISAGTAVQSESSARITRLAYAYSLMNDSQKELGVMAGVHLTRYKTEVTASGALSSVQSKLSTPLPVIGAFGGVHLGTKMRLDAKVQFFRMDFDSYDGSLNFLYLGLQRLLGDWGSAGIGYNYYSLKLDSSNEELNGSVDVLQHGPIIFVSAHF